MKELVGVPGCSQRSCFGFAVAHDHSDNQIRIVKGRAERMGDAVAEFAAFVDRARGLRRAVASDAAGEGEFLEELASCHPSSSLLFGYISE